VAALLNNRKENKMNLKDWNKLELEPAELGLCVSLFNEKNKAATEQEADRYEVLFIEGIIQLAKKYNAQPHAVLNIVTEELKKGENN
jgi:hypothetical protein